MLIRRTPILSSMYRIFFTEISDELENAVDHSHHTMHMITNISVFLPHEVFRRVNPIRRLAEVKLIEELQDASQIS